MYNYYLSNHLGNLRQQELIQKAEERRLTLRLADDAPLKLPRMAQRSGLPQRVMHLLNTLLH